MPVPKLLSEEKIISMPVPPRREIWEGSDRGSRDLEPQDATALDMQHSSQGDRSTDHLRRLYSCHPQEHYEDRYFRAEKTQCHSDYSPAGSPTNGHRRSNYSGSVYSLANEQQSPRQTHHGNRVERYSSRVEQETAVEIEREHRRRGEPRPRQESYGYSRRQHYDDRGYSGSRSDDIHMRVYERGMLDSPSFPHKRRREADEYETDNRPRQRARYSYHEYERDLADSYYTKSRYEDDHDAANDYVARARHDPLTYSEYTLENSATYDSHDSKASAHGHYCNAPYKRDCRHQDEAPGTPYYWSDGSTRRDPPQLYYSYR